MRILLDTHIALWAVSNPDRLSDKIRTLLEDAENEVHVSAASIWEIGIKFALDRRDAPPFSAKEAIGHFTDAGFTLLDITPDDTVAASELPLRHGDPFDRLIVGQALEVPLRLITLDAKVAAYSDTIILMR